MRKRRFREVKFSFRSQDCSEIQQDCNIDLEFTWLWLFILNIILFLYCKLYSLITIYTLQDKITNFLELCSKENPFSNSLSIYLRWLNIKSIHSQELFPDPAMLGRQGKVFLYTEV